MTDGREFRGGLRFCDGSEFLPSGPLVVKIFSSFLARPCHSLRKPANVIVIGRMCSPALSVDAVIAGPLP